MDDLPPRMHDLTCANAECSRLRPVSTALLQHLIRQVRSSPNTTARRLVDPDDLICTAVPSTRPVRWGVVAPSKAALFVRLRHRVCQPDVIAGHYMPNRAPPTASTVAAGPAHLDMCRALPTEAAMLPVRRRIRRVDGVKERLR